MAKATGEEFNQLTQVYAICTLFMLCKYIFCLLYGANWNNHPPEDTEKFGERPVPEDIKRRERTFLNDVENIPLHFVIFWAAYVLCVFANISGNGKEETLALTCLMPIYTGFRTIFTLCYIYSLQPYRTIVFVLANLSVSTTACILVSCAFKVDGKRILNS